MKMIKSKKILVSIVNWNNRAATNKCLAGIAEMPRDTQPDVALIDNNSTKDEFAIETGLQKKLVSLKIIKNPENLGFAGGHNQNIKYAFEQGYGYIILLNNDSEIIDELVFRKLAAALDNCPEAIGANPTILKSQRPDIVWYGGGKLSFVTSYASHLKVGETADKVPASSTKVTLLTGGCLAISLKRTELQSLLLPENYFVYWEDTEWCARALRAGYELLYVPDAKVLHHVSSSLGVRSPTYIYYNIRNHLIFVRRNISAIYRPLCWLRIVWITIKYVTVILLRYDKHRLNVLRALWLAWLDGINGISNQAKRRL
jgi:GT2 family glycosyltransferase